MNYHLHENGWTVILDDFDFKIATQQDIDYLARLLATNTLVVIKKQSLTVKDELRIINMFKNPEPFIKPNDPDYIHCWVDGTNGIIQRVTGELNDHGKPGLAGHTDEMIWHCNDPYRKDRRPLVWLYGVKGTSKSRTSWNNNIMSYNDLDQETKNFYKTLKIVIKTGMDLDIKLEEDRKKVSMDFEYFPNLVHVNNAGKTGLFFPFLQMSHFLGMTLEDSRKIIEPLAEYTVQDKYCYHHDWDDGDIIIAEQWLGIHKRWEFEDITNRVLHRAVFDFPDQDYF